MARRFFPLIANALLFGFVACGGATDPGLFSNSGNPSSAAGASSEAGAAATAGNASAPPNQDGDAAIGGSTGVAGQASGGSSGSAGNAAGGAAATSGSGGTAGHAGAGGSSAGGGGAAAGAGGSFGGSGGSAGNAAGSGGSAGNESTCQELLAQAATQLEAARACNIAMNATQCTGKVKTTCNCEVPVENQDSAEAQAYEATLKQINAKKCVQICPAIACAAVNHAQCYRSSLNSTTGSCISNYALTPL